MFDARLRPFIDGPLDAIALRLVRSGVRADTITWVALAAGLGGAVLVAGLAFGWGLALFVVNRVLDGLDGAVARRTALTDRGGFLDIVCDFLVYAAFPLAFAFADPDRNALAAACLLASFIASGCTFLAFAAIAAKRGLSTSAQGHKSIYYLAGLAEGFETIAAFLTMCLWPAEFPVIAYGFAALCLVSAVARIVSGLQTLR